MSVKFRVYQTSAVLPPPPPEGVMQHGWGLAGALRGLKIGEAIRTSHMAKVRSQANAAQNACVRANKELTPEDERRFTTHRLDGRIWIYCVAKEAKP